MSECSFFTKCLSFKSIQDKVNISDSLNFAESGSKNHIYIENLKLYK